MGRPRCCQDFIFVLCDEIQVSRQASRPAESQSEYASPEEALPLFGQPSTPAREGEEEK